MVLKRVRRFYDNSCAIRSTPLTDGYIQTNRIHSVKSTRAFAAYCLCSCANLMSCDLLGKSVLTAANTHSLKTDTRTDEEHRQGTDEEGGNQWTEKSSRKNRRQSGEDNEKRTTMRCVRDAFLSCVGCVSSCRRGDLTADDENWSFLNANRVWTKRIVCHKKNNKFHSVRFGLFVWSEWTI